MAEEMYFEQLDNGSSWKCVKSQLQKTGGKSPITGKMVYSEMAVTS